MSTLTVWKFDSADGAERAMRRIADAQADGLLVVDDAAWVSWTGAEDARTLLPQSGGSLGTLSRRFWALLFAALFLLPLSAAAAGTGLGADTGVAELGVTELGADLAPPVVLQEVGIDDGFIREVRDTVVAGTSALFVLSHDAVVHRLPDPFARTHVALAQRSFSRAEEARLRAVFAPGDAASAVPAPGRVLPPS
ncbi:DUF1269 domain-containing protein [Puerhibacterium puerhi]|uniref:DUF1269 domain-containing protein n=1 Tax=Puerhibacterium puerhi TaxID=2692623 RepID=UPI00135C4C57|nr:DUF1269 domain-containing protein [Puerhibacterium puerhi]